MMISAKAEYACAAMMELAAHYHSPTPVRIREIYEAHGISSRFLVQILLQLKTAGLVASVRGAAGGYQLSRPPEKITLGEIIRTIESRKEPPRPALSKGKVKKTPVVEVLLGVWKETLYEIWDEARLKEQQALDRLTLAELVRRTRTSDALVYQI